MKPTGELEVRRYTLGRDVADVSPEPDDLPVAVVPATDYDSLATAHAALVAELDAVGMKLIEQRSYSAELYAERNKARAERDALTARCSELEGTITSYREAYKAEYDKCDKTETERDDLRAKLQAAEKDAARYRWLRDVAPPGQPIEVFQKMHEARHLVEAFEMFCTPCGSWDASIDAALAQTKGEGE